MSSINNRMELYSPTIQAMGQLDLAYLANKWQKKAMKYQNVVQIASQEHINIQKQIEAMDQVIADLPPSNSLHQLYHIKALYGIRMYKKYTKEIKQKFPQRLYYKNENVALNEFNWELNNVKITFDKWTKIAQDLSIDIDIPLKKMEKIIADQFTDGERAQARLIKISYQTRMYKSYCIQIISLVAHAEIVRLADYARHLPQIENNQNLIDLIDGSEKHLLKYLPVDSEQSIANSEKRINLTIENTELRYAEMKHKMGQIRDIIRVKAKIK